MNNKPTSGHQQESEFVKQINPIDADRLLDISKKESETLLLPDLISSFRTGLLAILEQAEIWREQIKSLEQELDDKNQLLQNTQEELRQADEELSVMNAELQLLNALGSKPVLTLDRAKEVARIILANQKPTHESLAALLSEIYGSSIEACELEQEPISILDSRPS